MFCLKGPVDAVTNDARYSLSEERLLREQIDHGFVVIISSLHGYIDLTSSSLL